MNREYAIGVRIYVVEGEHSNVDIGIGGYL